MIVSFGDCRLDLRTQELSRAGDPVHLQPKMFTLLALLLEARPAVVEKELILDRLWPGVFTSESSLPVLVSALREALGDDSRDPRYIRTVHRVGYAFLSAATTEPIEGVRGSGESAASGHALVIAGRDPWVLGLGDSFLGRVAGNDVTIDDPSVSRVHAKLLVIGGALLVEDLGSKNGTWHEAVRITGSFAWRPATSLRFGEVLVLHRGPDFESGTETMGPESAVRIPRRRRR